MGDLEKQLRALYEIAAQSQIRPGQFGHGFNLAPKPDVFGRATATPLQIQKARDGINPNPYIEQVPYDRQPRQRKEVVFEPGSLEEDRALRQIDTKQKRRRGKNNGNYGKY